MKPDKNISGTLRVGSMPMLYDNHAQDSRVKQTDVAPTLNLNEGMLPLVQECYRMNILGLRDGAEDTETAGTLDTDALSPSQNQEAMLVREYSKGGETCDTITAKWAKGYGGPAGDEVGNMVTEKTYCIKGASIGRKDEAGPQHGSGVSEDQAYTLNTVDRDVVAQVELSNQGVNSGNRGWAPKENPSYTLDASGMPTTGIATSSRVRRLTPVECERLQGFPDGFTRVPYRGKTLEECPDGPRYKALGNSIAVPVLKWIGDRIMRVEEML